MAKESGRRYLGDGVYADYIEDAWGDVLVITTEDSGRITNTIHLDQERWRELVDFVNDHEEKN